MTTPQTPGGSGDRVPQYVYGVVRSDAALPQDVAGLDDRPVSLVRTAACAPPSSATCRREGRSASAPTWSRTSGC